MSQLQQLKARLDQIGNEAKSTAGNLSAFHSKFAKAVNEVEQAIGGSAQRTDKQIIQTLQAADKQVQAAVQALQQAAQTAQQYAARM